MITMPHVVHTGVTRLWIPRHCVVVMCGRSMGSALANSTHAVTIYPLGVYVKDRSGLPTGLSDQAEPDITA